MICAWCPEFDPREPANRSGSHVMCLTCQAKLIAQSINSKGKK